MCGLKTGKGTLPTTAGTVGQVCQPTVFNILIRYFSMKSPFFSVLILPCISWQKMWNLLKNSWELDLILLPEPLLQPAKTSLCNSSRTSLKPVGSPAPPEGSSDGDYFLQNQTGSPSEQPFTCLWIIFGIFALTWQLTTTKYSQLIFNILTFLKPTTKLKIYIKNYLSLKNM